MSLEFSRNCLWEFSWFVVLFIFASYRTLRHTHPALLFVTSCTALPFFPYFRFLTFLYNQHIAKHIAKLGGFDLIMCRTILLFFRGTRVADRHSGH